MPVNTKRFVIILDESLPAGLAANAAAVLSTSVGCQRPEIVGHNVQDGTGGLHAGITTLPIAILKAGQQAIQRLRSTAEEQQLLAAGFTRTAQRSKNYGHYEQRMSACRACDLEYAGIALFGCAEKITSLTGSLSLLR